VHLPTLHLPTQHVPALRRTDAVARSAAVVMVACAAVHVAGALQHWSPALSLLTIGVAAVCLHCVHQLWTAPRVVDWVWVTLGSAAMLVLHLFMLAQPAGSGHPHAALPTSGGSPLDLLTTLGLALPLVGLGLAWWGLGSVRAGSLRNGSLRNGSLRGGTARGDSLRVGVALDDHRADRRRDR
jgi:hypothetical protein